MQAHHPTAQMPETVRPSAGTASPSRSAREALAAKVRDDLAACGVDLADANVRLALVAVAEIANKRSLWYGDTRSSCIAYVGVVSAAAVSAAERQESLVG